MRSFPIWFPLLLASLWAFSAFAESTVENRLLEHAPALERLQPLFRRAHLPRIPTRGVLVFYKDTRRLDLYAGKNGAMKFVKTYPVLAASGTLGPKLREGDLQVPEGIYRITLLNPNSRFHLSLRLNYPNEFDIAKGRSDRRENLGGDIMIHGNEVSIGCIAIGDPGIEEIFTFAAKSELSQWKVILAPYDFRKGGARRIASGLPRWVSSLYADIESELRALPKQNQLR